MVDGDVAGHRQAEPLGLPHHVHALGAGEPGEMHARARFAREDQDGGERDRLGAHRYCGKPQPRRNLPVMRDPVACERGVLRAQPHRESERRRVLQRVVQHLVVGKRRIGLGERNAARVHQLRHLGEPCTFQPLRERAHRIDACPVEVLGAELQHLHQPRLIERRIGVGRAGETGYPAGDGRFHLRFQGRHVLETRLAQPRREVHQSRADDQSGCVDHAIGGVAVGRLADGHDLAGGDVDVFFRVHAAFRVDQPAAFNMDFHCSCKRSAISSQLAQGLLYWLTAES